MAVGLRLDGVTLAILRRVKKRVPGALDGGVDLLLVRDGQVESVRSHS